MDGSHSWRMAPIRPSCRYVRNAAFTTNALADRRHFRPLSDLGSRQECAVQNRRSCHWLWKQYPMRSTHQA
jgi:hypothetical protein